MGYKTLVSMNIAIVGNSRYSEAIAEGLAKVGHNIFIATKSEDDHISDELLWRCKNVCPSSPDYAGAIADIIIMATPPCDVREMAYLLDDVRNKVIIDLTGMNFSRYGEYINTASAIKAITGSAHVIKCYNRTGSERELLPLADTAAEMIIAGDSKKGKAVAKLLAKDLCFHSCDDLGGDDMIPLLDGISLQWQSSALHQKLPNSIAYKLIRR